MLVPGLRRIDWHLFIRNERAGQAKTRCCPQRWPLECLELGRGIPGNGLECPESARGTAGAKSGRQEWGRGIAGRSSGRPETRRGIARAGFGRAETRRRSARRLLGCCENRREFARFTSGGDGRRRGRVVDGCDTGERPALVPAPEPGDA